MKALSRTPHTTRWEETGCRDLALGVIDRAFRDLTGIGGSRADQESARMFLSGSSMFSYWCAVASLDPTWMVARARELTTASSANTATRLARTPMRGVVLDEPLLAHRPRVVTTRS